MFDSIKEIDSRWETEKRWLEDRVQRSSTETTIRKLTMVITADDRDQAILRFRDGPTGFEAYHLEDLKLEGEGDFCICMGTANRWPACFVNKAEVQKFIDEYKATTKIS